MDKDYKSIRDKKYQIDSKDRLSKILKKKVQTTMIGALSSMEKYFGYLWNSDTNKLTEDQKKMLELYNMDIHDFKNVSHLDLDLQGEALCKGTIDAAVYSVGHPDISLSKTASLCDIKIISINNKAIQNLITEKPYFIYTTIKAGTYPGINLDIKTLGVMATLVASQNLSNNYIYNLMNKINNSNLKLKLIHPALHDINLDTMVPLHPGAEEFYRQNH